MLFAPLEGWRHVEMTGRHSASDYTAILRDLSDRYFPVPSEITLARHNLSTYTAASLYAAVVPVEARRIAKQFDWYHTARHGDWLNMAESELVELSSQCLDRRIEDKDNPADEAVTSQEH
jgi:hypothetical protein